MPSAVAALAFLVGHWTDGNTSEQWVDAGHALFGVGFAPGREGTTFEFLKIHQPDDQVQYVAQPRGGPPVAFPLVSIDGHTVVFVNPEHDDPQRIRYTQRGKRFDAAVGPAEGPDRATFRLRARPPADASSVLEADRAFAAAVAAAPAGPDRVGAWISGFHPDGFQWNERRGRITPDDGVREAMGPVLEGQLAWTPTAGGMAPAGDLGFTVGSWTWTPPGGTEPSSRGSYVTVWRQDAAGSWRVLFDTGESSP